MNDHLLFRLQRWTALILGPLVIVHLLLIIYATRGGLTAAEILARTQGSAVWASLYGLFVLAAAIHAPIGIRNILNEWTPITRRTSDIITFAFGLLLVGLGLRAVIAVTL